jgi:hypothetical protein
LSVDAASQPWFNDMNRGSNWVPGDSGASSESWFQDLTGSSNATPAEPIPVGDVINGAADYVAREYGQGILQAAEKTAVSQVVGRATQWGVSHAVETVPLITMHLTESGYGLLTSYGRVVTEEGALLAKGAGQIAGDIGSTLIAGRSSSGGAGRGVAGALGAGLALRIVGGAAVAFLIDMVFPETAYSE